MLFVIETSHHHNSDKPTTRRLVDVPAGADPLAVAVVEELPEFAIEPSDAALGVVSAAIAEARAANANARFSLSYLPDDPELAEFTVWHETENGKLNFGFGPDDGKDKSENVWLTAVPYVPDPAVRTRLEAMPAGELVELLLRVHAEGGLRSQGF